MRDRLVVIRIQGEYFHLRSITMIEDQEQRMILEALGYDVLDLWEETSYDPVALDEWVERHIEHGVPQSDFMLPGRPWAD